MNDGRLSFRALKWKIIIYFCLAGFFLIGLFKRLFLVS